MLDFSFACIHKKQNELDEVSWSIVLLFPGYEKTSCLGSNFGTVIMALIRGAESIDINSNVYIRKRHGYAGK